MKKHLSIFVFLLLALTAVRSPAQANQEQGIRLNGLVVHLSTYASGPITAEGIQRVLNIEDNTLEVLLINTATGLYVAYALETERLAEPSKLRVSIKPLTPETIQQMRESVWVKRMWANRPELRQSDPLPPPRYPAPQVFNLGDNLKLELWLNAATGAVIGDRLRFTLDEPEPVRDFTLADVRFKFTGFRLSINGEVRSGERTLGGFSGSLPWFALPGKGRFLISLQPHAGYDFRQIGLVEGKKLSFNEGGDSYEWVSDEAILPARGRWRVWVLHDKDYQSSATALADVNLVSKGNCCLYGALSNPDQISR